MIHYGEKLAYIAAFSLLHYTIRQILRRQQRPDPQLQVREEKGLKVAPRAPQHITQLKQHKVICARWR